MFEMSSPPQSADEHFPVGDSMSQINPDFELHVSAPHPQSALFGVVPSIMLHNDAL